MSSSSARLVFVLIGFLLGIGTGSVSLSSSVVWGLLFVFLVFSFLLVRSFLLIIGACLFFAFGSWYVGESFHQIEFAREHIVDYEDDSFVGVVVEYPDVRRDTQKLVVRVDESFVKSGGVRGGGGIRVLVDASRFLDVSYGDVVRVVGEVVVPEPFDAFRYDHFLAVSGISGVSYRSDVEVLGRDPPSHFLSSLFANRLHIENRLDQLFVEPEGAFLKGLLLGSRSGLSPRLMDAFNLTGMTHIVALSGANITILAVAVFGVLAGPIHRRLAFVFTLCAILVFVLLTGFSSSVVRAGMMGGLVLVAREIGRPVSAVASLNLLLLSAVAMTLWRPLALVWDVGFQLSFAATFGVLFLAPLLDSYARWIPKLLAVRESVVLSVASQIMTLPLVFWHFGRIALIAPLANVLVLPILPWAMLGGFLALVVDVPSEPLALQCAYVTHYFLAWPLWVITLLATVAS